MVTEKPLSSKPPRPVSISIPSNQAPQEESLAKGGTDAKPPVPTPDATEGANSSSKASSSAIVSPLVASEAKNSPFPHTLASGTQSVTGAGSSANQSALNVAEGPSVINKQLLSKLNKSLKEKQRIINNSKSDSKNPALIQKIVTTSPVHGTFPGNVSDKNEEKPDSSGAGGDRSNDHHERSANDNEPLLHPPSGHSRTETPLSALPSLKGSTSKVDQDHSKSKKKISKQNSTRTDFFAAKLASAVDDVDTSDSDETFVYENSNNDFEAPNASSSKAGPATLHRDDTDVSTNNNANANANSGSNNNVSSAGVVHENESASASVRNMTPLDSAVQSPSVEKKEHDEPSALATLPNPLYQRAELIHSVQSSKWNLRNTVTNSNVTPPTTQVVRNQQNPMSAHGSNSGSEVHLFANPYIDLNKGGSIKNVRKSSSQSLINNDHKANLNLSPRYAASNQNFGFNSPGAHSHEGSHDRYSFDEDGIMCDEVSYQGDVALVCTDFNNTVTQSSEQPKDDHLALNSRSTDKNHRSSTTSLKLRSTTSKLFDKKGAQPRRYSIIPDDIDIEDFDDDLIYYDNNNIRFPYNSQNGSHLNESTSLLNHHRMPHYRSLNLSNTGPRQHVNNKRYSSMGFNNRAPLGNNIYPFPYHDQKYQFDLDNYDEEATMDSPDEVHAKSIFANRNNLSPSNTHFRLPRKVSDDSMRKGRVRCLKSFVYTMVSIVLILAIGFIMGFLLASTKELSNLSIVNINNALVSQDELLFSVIVEAVNPGWFTVSIEDVEIDIFAKSGYLKDELAGTLESTVETVLLGSVTSFESTVDFHRSFFNREFQQQKGEIKLVAPGRNLTGSIDTALLQSVGDMEETENPDNSEKWEIIRKHPFDLILRGVLKYKLPLSNTEKSAVVDKVGYIDPEVPQGTI